MDRCSKEEMKSLARDCRIEINKRPLGLYMNYFNKKSTIVITWMFAAVAGVVFVRADCRCARSWSWVVLQVLRVSVS